MTDDHDEINGKNPERSLGDILGSLLAKISAGGGVNMGQISGFSDRLEKALIDGLVQTIHDQFSSEFPPHIVILTLTRNLAIAAGQACKAGHDEAMLDGIIGKLKTDFKIVYDAAQREAAERDADPDPDAAAERAVVEQGGYD